MKNKGFTLMEMLVVVLIMIILITVAVPMYERAVEKSRRAEISTVLKQLSDSKQRTIDAMDVSFRMGCTDSCFVGMQQLDIEAPTSEDFRYSLCPDLHRLGVCAVRSRGDNTGTTFVYLSEENCFGNDSAPCQRVRNDGVKLFCSGTGTACDDYGMENTTDIGRCL